MPANVINQAPATTPSLLSYLQAAYLKKIEANLLAAGMPAAADTVKAALTAAEEQVAAFLEFAEGHLRANPPTAPWYGGTGLGLNLANGDQVTLTNQPVETGMVNNRGSVSVTTGAGYGRSPG